MKKSKNYDLHSSIMSFLLVVVFLLLMLVSIFPFMNQKKNEVTSKDNVISIDLAIFQEKKVDPPTPPPQLIKPQPTERKIVELTKSEETVIPEIIKKIEVEPLVEVFEESHEEAEPTEDIVETTIESVESESENAVESVKRVPIFDRNLVASQLVSLINRKKVYSRRAQQRGAEGVVTVQITLSEDCIITSYTIIGNSNSLLKSSVASTMDKIIGTDISEEVASDQLIIAVPIEFKLI